MPVGICTHRKIVPWHGALAAWFVIRHVHVRRDVSDDLLTASETDNHPGGAVNTVRVGSVVSAPM